MQIFVLTTTYNLYDQQGEYFVTAWGEKPTFAMLAPHMPQKLIEELLDKGQASEEPYDGPWQTYYLHQVLPGKDYHQQED